MVTTDQEILANTLVLVALALAVGLTARAAWIARADWGGPMGPARWDPRESWASTITAVGAVLATVLSTPGLLPAETSLLSRRQFTALSLLFGLLTVITPFVYNATRRRVEPGKGPPDYRGSVRGFLLASATILWSVLGQLLTLTVLVRELRFQGSLPSFVGLVVQAVVGLTLLAVLPYAGRAIWAGLEAGSPQAGVAGALPRGWSVP